MVQTFSSSQIKEMPESVFIDLALSIIKNPYDFQILEADNSAGVALHG